MQRISPAHPLPFGFLLLSLLASTAGADPPAGRAGSNGVPTLVAQPDLDGCPAAPALDADDRRQLRTLLDESRHAVRPTEEGHRAECPGQGWSTDFDSKGFTVRPSHDRWRFGFELVAYDFDETRTETDRPLSAIAEGRRMTYRWSETVEEWFVNRQSGIEHGFTLESPPSAEPGTTPSSWSAWLALRGELQPVLLPTGRGLELRDSQGRRALDYSGLVVYDATGRELPAELRLEDGLVRLITNIEGARYPITVDPIVQHVYFKASNTDIGDGFARAVAVSGDTIVIGTGLEQSAASGVNGDQADNSLPLAGAAYVFSRSGGTWAQEAYLKSSAPDVADYFGDAVAISGDTIVVGARKEDSGATTVNGDDSDNSREDSGAAYVFVRSGGTWSQQAYLKGSASGVLHYFGSTVDIVGDTILVGAPGNVAGNAHGAAYVFTRTGSTWTEEAHLTTSTSHWIGFGTAVALGEDEDRAAIGSPPFDGGRVLVFDRIGGTWTETATLAASNGDDGDAFGGAVDISGNTIVVGARGESSGATGVNGPQNWNGTPYAGAAYVFDILGGNWHQRAYLKSSNTATNDFFGSSVAIDRDTILVGANGENVGSQNTGAAYVFTRSLSAWSQRAQLTTSTLFPDAYFGNAVAIDGSQLLIGAWGDPNSGTGVNGGENVGLSAQTGAAYLFDEWLDPVGVSYCQSTPNSTGLPATISAGGTDSVAANQLTLYASPVAPHQPGLFFYGPVQTQVVFGNGFRCIGGGATGLARLPVIGSGIAGSLRWDLDLTDPPIPSMQILPGSTWYFQAWFRDPAGGGAFIDLSDGLAIDFVP